MEIFIIVALVLAALVIWLLVDRHLLKSQLLKSGVQEAETLGQEALKEVRVIGRDITKGAKWTLKEAERLIPMPSLAEIEADLAAVQAKIARAIEGHAANLAAASANAEASQTAMNQLTAYQATINNLVPAISPAPAPAPAPAGAPAPSVAA